MDMLHAAARCSRCLALRGTRAAAGQLQTARKLHGRSRTPRLPGCGGGCYDRGQMSCREEITMTRFSGVVLALLIVGLSIWQSPQASGQNGWTALFNGKNLDGWDKVGQSNWRIEDGAIVADKNAAAKGSGFVVTKNSYGDFQLRVEFWASDDANSGIYMRCADRNNLTDKTCYEANIFDQRPDPSFGTGGIVHIAKVAKPFKAGGKWNTYEINLKGPQLTVVLNGEKTAEAKHEQFKSGPIALQHGKGVIKFRKVDIRKQ
jgi:hypothetical protein